MLRFIWRKRRAVNSVRPENHLNSLAAETREASRQPGTYHSFLNLMFFSDCPEPNFLGVVDPQLFIRPTCQDEECERWMCKRGDRKRCGEKGCRVRICEAESHTCSCGNWISCAEHMGVDCNGPLCEACCDEGENCGGEGDMHADVRINSEYFRLLDMFNLVVPMHEVSVSTFRC